MANRILIVGAGIGVAEMDDDDAVRRRDHGALST